MFLSVPYISGSQSVGWRPLATASPGKVLEIQIFKASPPSPWTESETWGVGPSSLCFNKSSLWFWCSYAALPFALDTFWFPPPPWNVGSNLWLIVGLVAVDGEQSTVVHSGDLGWLLCRFLAMWLWASQLAFRFPHPWSRVIPTSQTCVH